MPDPTSTYLGATDPILRDYSRRELDGLGLPDSAIDTWIFGERRWAIDKIAIFYHHGGHWAIPYAEPATEMQEQDPWDDQGWVTATRVERRVVPTARWVPCEHGEDGAGASNLARHARRELELSGQYNSDPEYSESIIAAAEAFASYGHSGGSAVVAREQLHTLLRFGTLSPLTSDPNEWMDVSETSGTPMWQSKRNPQAFSVDGGKTWYLLDDGKLMSKVVGNAREAADQVPEGDVDQ